MITIIKTMATIYHTHDNGGRPFIVEINDSEVSISKNRNHWQHNKIVTYRPKKIFIGTHNDKNQDLAKNFFDGNSILLHIQNLDYVFIGHCIYTFRAEKPIVEYNSPVGNSNVPYPYAIDQDGNVYLLIEDVILLNCDKLKAMVQLNPENFHYYGYYYDNHRITTISENVPASNFENIKEYYEDDVIRNLFFYPDYCSYFETKRLKIIYESGSEKQLTENEFWDLMYRYGKFMGFKKLEKVMIHDRIWG